MQSISLYRITKIKHISAVIQTGKNKLRTASLHMIFISFIKEGIATFAALYYKNFFEGQQKFKY